MRAMLENMYKVKSDKPLKNLRKLKDDMAAKGWTICSFPFKYKKVEYFVLVKRFVGSEKRIDEYALVKLQFVKAKDIKDDLEVEANVKKVIADINELRAYFGIEYYENVGDLFRQFSSQLGKYVPAKIPTNPSNGEITAMVRSLSKSDSEDPSKIYCNGVRRNPEGQKRSEYNSDKTKLLRQNLYDIFRNEKNVSFCYYSDKEKENDDEAILKKFTELHGRI